MSLDDVMAIPEKPKGPVKDTTALVHVSKDQGNLDLTSVYSGGTKRRVGDIFLDTSDTTNGQLMVQTHHGAMPYDAYGMNEMWD